MIIQQCADCGAKYPANVRAAWGRTKETSGHGPVPKCVALVPSEGAPKAPDGSIPQQVCGGSLVALDDPQAKPETVRAFTAL